MSKCTELPDQVTFLVSPWQLVHIKHRLVNLPTSGRLSSSLSSSQLVHGKVSKKSNIKSTTQHQLGLATYKC
eukprot:3010811-Amphidinium_carterae.1